LDRTRRAGHRWHGASRAGLDFEEGRWLLAAQRARVHERLGYGSFLEYVERLFGYAPRLTQDNDEVVLGKAGAARQDLETD
jgi:hypothetical protein